MCQLLEETFFNLSQWQQPQPPFPVGDLERYASRAHLACAGQDGGEDA